MKHCRRCDIEKPLDCFWLDVRKRDGRCSWCKECAKQRARELRTNDPKAQAAERTASARRKSVLRRLVTLVKSRPCPDCGQTFPAAAMQFDHVRGEKTADVSSLVRWIVSVERLLDEIEKCEVVCANCHFIRTATRRTNK